MGGSAELEVSAEVQGSNAVRIGGAGFGGVFGAVAVQLGSRRRVV